MFKFHIKNGLLNNDISLFYLYIYIKTYAMHFASYHNHNSLEIIMKNRNLYYLLCNFIKGPPPAQTDQHEY